MYMKQLKKKSQLLSCSGSCKGIINKGDIVIRKKYGERKRTYHKKCWINTERKNHERKYKSAFTDEFANELISKFFDEYVVV